MSHITDVELQAFLDRELNPAQQSLIMEHVDACTACKARLDEFRRLFSDIESLPEARLHVDLAPGVLSRLAPQPVIGARARRLLLAELALGCGALLAALSWVNLSPPVWIEGLVPSLQAWINPGALTVWLRSLATPVQAGISAFESLSASAAAPLTAAFPVSGWAAILAGSLLMGLAANGLLLTRVTQPRREDRGSA